MTTFDQTLEIVSNVFIAHSDWINTLPWMLVNRDLYGRIRLIIPEDAQETYDNGAQSITQEAEAVASELSNALGPHAFTPSNMLLYETTLEQAKQNATVFQLTSFANVWVADRLATESCWEKIAPISNGAPRIVFYSIKGGVGRSTALSALAWSLAQEGKRVLIVDLDLESPGLSTSLLPEDRQPKFGVTDWLLEDLVDNTEIVIESMIATSDLARDGEIFVTPAHGAEPGDYISKLGRIWMPKISKTGKKEGWSERLNRLINELELKTNPDVILLDSRAGIDEVASTCLTDLGAKLILLFAVDGSQTWSGYQILFEHWLQRNAATTIRERLQLVGALIPETEEVEYVIGLREHAADLFSLLYDAVPAGEPAANRFHFEESDPYAPHSPWEIRWHRSFAALSSLAGRLAVIDKQLINQLFGAIITGVNDTLELTPPHD